MQHKRTPSRKTSLCVSTALSLSTCYIACKRIEENFLLLSLLYPRYRSLLPPLCLSPRISHSSMWCRRVPHACVPCHQEGERREERRDEQRKWRENEGETKKLFFIIFLVLPKQFNCNDVRREKVHQGPQILQIKIMISHDTQSS